MNESKSRTTLEHVSPPCCCFPTVIWNYLADDEDAGARLAPDILHNVHDPNTNDHLSTHADDEMAIAPITGKLRKRFWLDLTCALGTGVAAGYAFW